MIGQKDLINRIVQSVHPLKTGQFIEGIEANPDLYGPFWISTMLVFMSIICSSGSFVFNRIIHREAKQIEYDHKNLGYVVSLVYGFLFFVPFAMNLGAKVFGGGQTSYAKVDSVQ